jgi:PAS domain S-box-containing protein
MDAYTADAGSPVAQAGLTDWFVRILGALQVGVGLFAPGGRLAEVNSALLAMVGHTREQFESGTIDWPTRLLSDEFLETDAMARIRALEGGVVEPYERAFLTAQGKRLPVRITVVGIDGKAKDSRFRGFECAKERRSQAAADFRFGHRRHRIRRRRRPDEHGQRRLPRHAGHHP